MPIVPGTGAVDALRGEGNRAFYRWLRRELKPLFPRLPERTRLFRLLAQYACLTQRFLGPPSLFGVCDSFGIELLHPKREGRSSKQIGKKGKSNWRWIVGAKLGLLCNGQGQVVDWQCSTANVYDATFHPLLEKVQEQMIVLCDRGFYSRQGNPANLKVCPRNTWNERMTVETVFSLFTRVLHLKELAHRSWPGLQARLAYAVAIYNLCITWSGEIKISLAEFAL